ncbi:MAG: type II toxin-antitoxin system RelE/ParE family toxin [Firmicutes bacterium]|nr:type II toxin-antitoxin system RelE/ParE family toxin [Bacillota bacterium]
MSRFYAHPFPISLVADTIRPISLFPIHGFDFDYLIFYTVRDDLVEIRRILHGKRKYDFLP